MNNNILVGVLAAIIVIGGGVWLVSSGYYGSGMATSTPQTSGDTTGSQTTTTVTTTTAAAPLATTGTLIVASNSTAIITGTIIPNGSQTSYWYEYGKTTNLGTRTTTQNIGSGYASINAPAYLTGLSANTSYSFRLVAQNDSGTVNGSVISFVTNNNPPSVGNAPTVSTDAATSVTSTGATLNGRVNPNNAGTSYWFEYGNSSGLGNTTVLKSAGALGSSINGSAAVSGLAPGTKYYFRMNAQNQFGTVNGSILVFTTPDSPVALKAPVANTSAATSIAVTSATLNGSVNPNGDSTSYWFEYSKGPTLDPLLGTSAHTVLANSSVTMTTVSINLTGLTANTTYSYRLVAQSASGLVGGNILTFKTKR